MNILEEIAAYKIKEVQENKDLYPVKLLERSIFFKTPCVSLKNYLNRKDKVGIIAEIKKKSPSKGIINKYANIEKVSIGYMQAGASALSVLTDEKYFGGKNEDLTTARKYNYCPILRKDFTVDEYQVLEAKSIGADVILLIAAILTKEKIQELTKLAHSLGLQVILEVHDEDELEKINSDVDVIGINNRSLKTMVTDVEQSFHLSDKIPEEFLKISESGLKNADTLIKLKKAGFNGFLIGEFFMQQSNPQKACAQLIAEVEKQNHVN